MARRSRGQSSCLPPHLSRLSLWALACGLIAVLFLCMAWPGRSAQPWLARPLNPGPPADPSSHVLAAVSAAAPRTPAGGADGDSMRSWQRSRQATVSGAVDAVDEAAQTDAATLPGLGEPPGAPPHKFPFRLPEEPGSWTYSDMQWCPGSQEPPAEKVATVDPRLRMLMIVGAQKAGTTWLHHALEPHPSMVQGVTRAKKARGTRSEGKELQFFSRWPPLDTDEFMSMWPEDEIAAMLNGTSRKFLIDASPEYLVMPAAPPRIKQVVPQAKIVVVLRDPTERSFSSWSMVNDRKQHCNAPGASASLLCGEPTFLDTFTAFRSRAEFTARPECEFRMPGADMTWGDCFSCLYGSYENSTCMARMRAGEDMFPCERKQLNIFDYSTYAPQLAWWLHFFPPDQMLITTSDVLHDPDRRIEFLNQVLDFLGLDDVPRVAPEHVNEATAFNGNYEGAAPADEAAKATLREYYEPQARDLRALLRRYFPASHLNLMGFPLLE